MDVGVAVGVICLQFASSLFRLLVYLKQAEGRLLAEVECSSGRSRIDLITFAFIIVGLLSVSSVCLLLQRWPCRPSIWLASILVGLNLSFNFVQVSRIWLCLGAVGERNFQLAR